MPVPLTETSLTSEKSAVPFYLSSEQALQEYLESTGVDTSKFGKGNAKPLSWLYQELQEGTCYLESPHQSSTSPTSPADRRPKRLLRVVEPIFIRLRFRSRVLVQDKQQFPDGRFRVRNMLLAEKKEPRDSGGLLSTIHRAINEELGVSLEALRREDVMQYRPDTYHFEIEHIDSPSYPGLASAYRTHHVQVDILETGLDVFMHCGLPEFSDFVTTEKTAHGVITLFWRWDDVNAALKRGVVKFPPKSLAPTMTRPSLCSVKSSGSLDAPEKSVLPANVLKDGGLALYLKKAGIDPDAYGRDKAKSLDSLLKEVECGETVLEWNAATSQIRRIMEPVFVQLRWGDQVLVEQEQVMSDGRTRSRNMLLAEKKKPEDTVVEQTVYRGLAEELLENYQEAIPDVSIHVRFMQEAYCCVAENLESSSYPGLPCVYITHYCAVQLLDSGLPSFEEIGMLEPQFDTKEEDGKINRWRWVDLDEARKTKVKGFPKLDENQNADTIGLWQLIESAPDDIGDLRVLLEMGGVNVSAWGMYAQDSLKSLLQEIQSGASTLERDDISGKVRRVICSSLVQLKVSGSKEAEKLNPGGLGFDLGDARSMVNYRADRGVWEVLHSDTASYPGLPCCYQTRLVQFESLKREALRKLPSDIVERIGGDDSKGNGRRNSQRSSQASSLNGSLTVPMSVMSPCQSSLASMPGSLEESPTSRQNVAADPKAELVDLPVEAQGIYRQVLHMHKDLRFRMVAKEASEKSAAPATHAVSCSCEILLIRNINPLTATYQCRFYIFMEWFDPAAIGMPPGDVSEENRKKLWIPEIALQNTLKTGVEIHYPPEIVFSEKGHVAAKVLYQAIMQMEIDMRLFPFDTQRLNIVLGLRARRDRDRAVFCRFCHVDSTIRLDEWKLLGAFHHTDRPDGRARVQFGVIIGRGYMYYVLNVLTTLCAIASSFAGYLLQLKPPFDRLRFCISILFAQTTFRLSIDSKLPIVAYATAFDHFAMACQLLLLSIILGVVIVVMLSDRWLGFGGEAAAEVVDKVFMFTLMPVWIFTLLGFSIWVARARREHQKVLQFNHADLDKDQQEDGDLGDFSPDAVEQIARLKGRLRYTSARRLSPTEVNISTDAVAVSTMVWFIHDIDPIQAQYECKFTAYIEWLSPNAVGLPEHIRLSKEELISLNMPEIDVRNKVELKVEEGPDAYVTDSTVGRIMVSTRYLAKLQLRLKLRNFPFDEQSIPIDFVMPSEKDNRRAFVFRNCELAPLAKNLDEWTVKDTWTRCDFHEGMSQATMFVQVRRNSKYYVVSVLGVLLGISSLVFTVWCIEVDENGRGFDDQGKILTPLLMTLLAFKLLTASGKIPKVAKATIFDRYVLATEACFFVTVFSCSLLRALITSGPEMAKMGGVLRFSFGLVLLLAWLAFLLYMAREVKRAKEESRDNQSSVHIPGFESACEKILQKPLIPICTFKRKAVLMEITIKHVFAINPAAANFTCEFEVNMAWLDAKAKQMPSGTKLDKEKCKKLGLPKLSVQNAQSCTTKFESGRIIDGQSGHVACKLKIKAQVLMTFDLRYFPWDEQSLFVVLVLNSQEDAHRYLVLNNCVSVDSVKAGEWAELGSFAKSYETGGNSKAVFGLQIKRFSRYYVTSLASLCLWSTFILFVYVLAVNDFRERGKIMVGVLLVQNVAKVAVSSKMPRVVRITAYDNMALNSLGLLFSIGICNALLDGLGQLKIPGLTFEVLTIVDRCLGLVLFCTWLLANAYVIFDVAKHSSEGKAVKAGNLPRQVAGIVPPDYTEPEEVLEDVEIIMRSPDPLSVDSAVRKTCSRSSEVLGEQVQVKVGVKFWLISDIDVASATYLAKFHVIMEWFDQAAVGVPVSTRISYEKLRDEAGRDGTIVVPQVGLKNAITVSLEEYSDVIVLENQKGLVTCRVHFNANLHNEFCLESFPFDCQRLLAELQLVNTGFELVPNFCNAGEQLKSLDGWNFTTAALAQPDDEIAANRQRVLVNVILERQSGFFVKQVLSIYWFLTTLMFSFFVLQSDDFTKRLVDILKIVLTQTTFRFSVEHRLPKVQVWTPFDVYLISCQILCCFIAAAYLASFIMSQREEKVCLTQEVERLFLLSLASLWVVWNLGFIIYAIHRKRQERIYSQQSIMGALEMSRFSGLLPRYSKSPLTVKRKGSGSKGSGSDGEEEMSPAFSHRGTGVEAFTGTSNQETQVISIAFRIWLIRNVDLVKATFECKFRVFLEWLDEAAVGLEKGKKAKELKVPSLAITNAVQAEVLDRSSAPEVVNPATGHVAAQVQMLFRATLRMDQQVRHFPFDCQWLAVTVSLKEEGCAQNRSFVFQYCEVDEGLSLDEWYLCPDPAFSTLTKQDAPSIQDTVMCGLLIRRASRYYVVNIMLMLGLISSIAFAIYTVNVSLFWERAEVFLGIFPLIVIFKMSAQGKLPRVGYSTKFDRFATACQTLFLVIVMGCMAASFIPNVPTWFRPCNSEGPVVFAGEALLAEVEHICCYVLISMWLAWIVWFTWQARQAQRLDPVENMQSRVPVKLQGRQHAPQGSCEASIEGLAPSLSIVAQEEKKRTKRPSLLVALGIVEDKEKHEKQG